MSACLKAIVIKTPRLKETLSFFTGELAFAVKESSPTHFVIHSKDIRVLFVGTNSGGGGDPLAATGLEKGLQTFGGLEIELYLTQPAGKELIVQQDPNNITVIIA